MYYKENNTSGGGFKLLGSPQKQEILFEPNAQSNKQMQQDQTGNR